MHALATTFFPGGGTQKWPSPVVTPNHGLHPKMLSLIWHDLLSHCWVNLRHLFSQKLTGYNTPARHYRFSCRKHQAWNTILVDSALRRHTAICISPQLKWFFAHIDRISPTTRGQTATGQNQSDRLDNSDAEPPTKSPARVKGSYCTEPLLLYPVTKVSCQIAQSHSNPLEKKLWI